MSLEDCNRVENFCEKSIVTLFMGAKSRFICANGLNKHRIIKQDEKN